MKKWKCTVCGYVHEGEEPPEKCPVCGADKSKFVAIEEDVPQKDASPKDEPSRKAEAEAEAEVEAEVAVAPPKKPAEQSEKIVVFKEFVNNQLLKHHVHPISVHIPNGVLPISFAFIILSVVLPEYTLGIAAYYNMIAILLALPMVIYSGYVEWKNKYGGNMTNVFLTKMICAGIVLTTSLAIVVWRTLDPAVSLTQQWTFLGLYAVDMGAATLAGFLGGKLVFKD